MMKAQLATVKLDVLDGGVDNPGKDYSKIVTDLVAMRTPQSEAAREVFAKARNVSGSIKTLCQGRSDVFRMNPYDLHIKPGWNVREMTSLEVLEQISYLADDISHRGVLEPYKVYLENGRYYISNGHLRQHAVFHAIERLNARILTVPVMLGSAGENEQDRALQQVHTNSGLRLSPWEQGTLIKRFLGWGWEKTQIAQEFSCTENHVSQMLDLQALPEPLAIYVRNGTIKASYAVKALKSFDGNVPKAVAEVESAIRWADHKGIDRVMPKHGRLARSGQTNGNGTTGGGDAKTPAAKKKLAAIVDILRNVTVRADGEGRWTISMQVEQGERLAKLTGMEVPAG